MQKKVKKINYVAGIKSLEKELRKLGYGDIHFSCRQKVDDKPMNIPFKDRVLKIKVNDVIRNVGIHRKTHCIGLTRCVARRKPDKGNYDVITGVSFCSSADEWDKTGGRFWALRRVWRIATDKDSFRESPLEGYEGYTSEYDVKEIKETQKETVQKVEKVAPKNEKLLEKYAPKDE